MAILPKVKKTLIYDEMQPIDRKRLFDLKDKKFIHNIDSLYYVIKVKNDWNHDLGCIMFRELLRTYKGHAVKRFQDDPYIMFQGGNFNLGTEFVMQGIGSAPYQFDISKVDKYMAFVMDHQLNEKTPEIWVQLRSQNLWLFGEYQAFEESLKDIERILAAFNVEIEEVKENRIDFAYHTNYIQDPTSYFNSKNINRMQKSRFERGGMDFAFRGQFDTETDYITLGRKMSNNLFFRIYDKTKEVIEQGYKQFFIKLWYMEGMISYFDMYCIEKAFLQPSRTNYKYLDIARLEFYIDFGQDQAIVQEAKDLINQKSLDYEAIIELADRIVPKVTKILNVEIETKRKFYYSMDTSVNTLLKVHTEGIPEYAKKMYVKLDNKQVFHDYITCNNPQQQGVIRFLNYKAKNKDGKPWTDKSKFPTSEFWQRLQGLKVNKRLDQEDVTLLREYQKTLSASLMKKKINNMIATYNLYTHGENVQNDLMHDALDYMSTINESDTEKAAKYKTKKFTLLQNRLGDVEGLPGKLEKKLQIVDFETGESFGTYH